MNIGAEYLIICPVCGSIMTLNTHNKRKVRYKSHTQIWRVPVFKCEKCKKYHTVLPDTLIPYKQYAASVISEAISGNDFSDCPAEDSTIRSWKKWYSRSKRFFAHVKEVYKMAILRILKNYSAPKKIRETAKLVNSIKRTASQWLSKNDSLSRIAIAISLRLDYVLPQRK
ncbi:MAG: DUF6431 domain-containing protein [Sphaerochaetaceae bacterium]|nr:DUF6431 domain-containing protein [Sphaerochaetaceae bacterium]